MSSPMRVEGEVVMGGEGRVYITPGQTRCARHAHARNTPEERRARWACVRSTLGVRPRRAMRALDHSRRTHNACPACAPRVSGVGPARSAHGWRPSGVYIHASSSAHSFVHAQKSRRTQRTTTNAQRWSSALDARVAHGDAHPANDDALAKIATFSARRPCVVPV